MFKILSPPKIESISNKLLFLAGPIQGATDWQSVAINKLKNCDITIANPRKVYLDNDFDYEKQVLWESFYLNFADIIVFWLPVEYEKIEGRSYAQTTRFELAEWLTKQSLNHTNKKLIVGIENGFSGKRYIETRIKHDYKNVSFFDTFDEVILKTREVYNGLLHG